MAIETRLDEIIDLVETNPHESPVELLEQNPLGKVPSLLGDDGFSLFDSPLICEYLDSSHGGTRMVPVATPARWHVLRLQAVGDGIMDAAVGSVMEDRRPEGERSTAFIDKELKKVRRSVTWLEDHIEELAGSFNLGQISVACALAYLDFRLSHLGWRDKHPQLSAWFEKANQRDSMRKTAL